MRHHLQRATTAALACLLALAATSCVTDEPAATDPPPGRPFATETDAEADYIAEVVAVFGACLTAAGVNLEDATVTSPPSTVPGDRDTDPRLVTFPGGISFVAQGPGGPLGPRVATPEADAALDRGEAAQADCLEP